MVVKPEYNISVEIDFISQSDNLIELFKMYNRFKVVNDKIYCLFKIENNRDRRKALSILQHLAHDYRRALFRDLPGDLTEFRYESPFTTDFFFLHIDEAMAGLKANCPNLKEMYIKISRLVKEGLIELSTLIPVLNYTSLDLLSIDILYNEKVLKIYEYNAGVRLLLNGKYIKKGSTKPFTCFNDYAPVKSIETYLISYLIDEEYIANYIRTCSPILRKLVVDVQDPNAIPRVLSTCQNLEILHVTGIYPGTNYRLMRQLRALPHLYDLSLAGISNATSVELNSFFQCANAKKLRYLAFFQCEAVTDEILASISCASTLERLVITHNDSITDSGVNSILSNCPRLTHLNLYETSKVRGNLNLTSSSERLKHLKIHNVSGDNKMVFTKTVDPEAKNEDIFKLHSYLPNLDKTFLHSVTGPEVY